MSRSEVTNPAAEEWGMVSRPFFLNVGAGGDGIMQGEVRKEKAAQ